MHVITVFSHTLVYIYIYIYIYNYIYLAEVLDHHHIICISRSSQHLHPLIMNIVILQILV